MRSTDIRSTFFDFFAARGHRRVPSSPLVPSDPTLLLANAGMNQFKPYFLGEAEPESTRLMSVQKCARTSDIENVGRTTRHATFFEMLGNFSFGDYFKAEAIEYAWRLLTDGYGLDRDRIWITVYTDDDEAHALWRGLGVPDERIQRLGMADNYWSMGVPGPCGPSSEASYDRGPAFGPEGGPAVNGERYVELWNLVFMQNLRGPGHGKDDYPIVGELPRRNIDTGLGLDRLAAILQGVDTVCETDLLAPTLRRVEELAGRGFPGRDGSEESVAFQVTAEHARSIAFLVADGVLPSNEGRGYVLRRLMRRAVHRARTLGITGPVLDAVTASVVDALGGSWPELARQRTLIEHVVRAEEEAFSRTLRTGSRLLEAAIRRTADSGGEVLPGDAAFELHDTYGFPVDLTVEAARAAGLRVDEERFAALLEEQRRRAQDGGRALRGDAVRRMDAYRALLAEHGPTRFLGYEATEAEGRTLAVLIDGVPVPAAGEGAEVELVLDATPFYAEAGGQVGDTGSLRFGNGAEVAVTGTRAEVAGCHVHHGRVVRGEVHAGLAALARVDAARRSATERSHSATHVLHAMLRRTLGDHAAQRGSLVAPGRLRFDFAHFDAVSPDELAVIERRVNDYLLADPEVRVWHTTFEEARSAGAMALFGEKYADRVRVVDIGDASRELCGGTHVGHGTQAGPVRLLGESSVGANLRRIEALTGADALRHYDHERHLLTELAGMLGARPEEAPARLAKRLAALAEARRELDRLRRERATTLAGEIADRARPRHGGWLVAEEVADLTADDLRDLAPRILERKGGTGVVVLGVRSADRANLVAALSDDLHARGVRADEVLTRPARCVGGGAGGRGRIANAGGRRPDGLPEALRVAAAEAERMLTG
ncbi:alanine--tRNA ligase [Marinactinospora rubrisoli]|uniref:Alanine--tRNA ligase n=1 Tax=Marinactinospora rubrisoli TaxID=2715399 RepID=A0ABW2KFC9_9ACTN